MSEIIERIKRIIRVKLWAKAKRQEMEKSSTPDTSSSNDDSPSGGVVAGVIGLIVVIIAVGIFILPLVSSMIDVMKSSSAINTTSNQSTNLTAMNDVMTTMLSLVPLFIMLSMIIGIINALTRYN